METFDLRKYLAENKLFEAAMACPTATQNLELNTKNRDAAIKAEYIQYGPLNVDEPGDYWTDKDGRLGYCWMHHFKCHSARSCRTWAKGGPITKDSVSYDWQERNKNKV